MAPTVRFAPSPTGHLHAGNIRAVLINWLFAKREGGRFILRLDDTDKTRNREHFITAIEHDLRWLGLTWDRKVRQSERMALYRAAAEQLKKQGRLYPCYETLEELELKRKMQLAKKQPPVYDRAALELSEAERNKLEREGRKPHWRFRLEHGEVTFDDLIRGRAHFDMASLSDPVLVREDGSFLYTLPSVADDIDLGITHVIRGEDHVTNSAVQVQVFEALGAGPPAFAHFPLITTLDEAGFSKRESALSVRRLREDGIEPEAILSLLAHLGTSDAVEPATDPKPLIAGFDFARFSRAAAKFDPHELETLNAKVVHALPYEKAKTRLPDLDFTAAEWEALRPNLEKLPDLGDWLKIIRGPVTPKIRDKKFIGAALALLPEGKLGEGSWQAWTKALSGKTGRKGKDLFKPLRLALTGLDHGPEMKLLLPLIGVDKAKKRLEGKKA